MIKLLYLSFVPPPSTKSLWRHCF